VPELWPRLWQEPGFAVLRTALAPLEWAYGLGVALRGIAFDRGLMPSTAGPIPVVSIGNLTVGGTGKTPVTAWLVRGLADMNRRPAIVTRGYGADEVALHRRWNPDVPVIVTKWKLDGVRQAATAGADVAILDDGFQHRRLRRDLDVVLIAAEQPFPAPLLPRGPFREPPSALRRADIVCITRKTASPDSVSRATAEVGRVHPSAPKVHIELAPAGWTSLDGTASSVPPGDTLTVASVAQPRTVEALVAQLTGHDTELLAYRDHHEYTRSDAESVRERARGRTIVATEKDAVKLLPFQDVLGDLRVLTLEVRVRAGAADLETALSDLFEQPRSA
jgi:tetraacyldisaccharide 4'-kinase